MGLDESWPVVESSNQSAITLQDGERASKLLWAADDPRPGGYGHNLRVPRIGPDEEIHVI